MKRENVEVSGGAILSINADMRVGGVQETITVSGETPVVDVQTSTNKQTVLDDSVIESLPSSRGYGNLLSAVPGIQNNSLDNGTNPTMVFFTAHGGRGNEGTVQIDGMNVGASFNGGGVSSFGYPTQSAAEVQVTVVGGLGEIDRGGPAFNIIPKTGGNSFSGEGFQSWAGDWSYGNNVDARQQAFIPDVPTPAQELGQQLRAGRPDRARPALVLRQRALVRHPWPTCRASTATRTPAIPTRGATSRIGASRRATPTTRRSPRSGSPAS